MLLIFNNSLNNLIMSEILYKKLSVKSIKLKDTSKIGIKYLTKKE